LQITYHNLVERVYWVGIKFLDEVHSSLTKDLSECGIQAIVEDGNEALVLIRNVVTCILRAITHALQTQDLFLFPHVLWTIFVDSVPSLRQYLNGDCYSTKLEGTINLEVAKQFFLMRYKLEEFLNKTHRIAKVYMKLHDELRRCMTVNNAHTNMYEEICNKEADLKNRWSALEADGDRGSLIREGSKVCDELLHKFPLLESCDPCLYRKAVEQAAKAFNEVIDVIKKSDATIKKRQKSLEAARYAVEFLDYKKSISMLLTVDLHEMERIVGVKTFNINRLTAQFERAKKIRERVECSLSEAILRNEKMQQRLEEGFNVVEIDPVNLQKEVDSFSVALNGFRTHADEIFSVSVQAVEARKAVDKAYDWALLFAKKGDNQAEVDGLVSSFPMGSLKVLKRSLAKGTLEEGVSKEVVSLMDDIVASVRKISGDSNLGPELENWSSLDSRESRLEFAQSEAALNVKDLSRKQSSVSMNEKGNGQQAFGSNGESATTDLQLGLEDRLSLLFNSASLSSSFTSLPSSNNHSAASLISPNNDHCVDMLLPFEQPCYPRPLTTGVADFPNSSETKLVLSTALGISTASDATDASHSSAISPVSENGPVRGLSSSISSLSERVSSNQLNGVTDEIEGDSNSDIFEARCSSPAPTQYEIPISKSNGSDYDGAEEMSCDEESGIRWRRNSWSSLPRVDERLSIDECAIGGAPLTLDLTDKVITCMSSNTLIKRLGQRRSVSGFPSRLPNPFLVNGGARPGSARFSSTYKTRPTLSRIFPIDQDRFSVASSSQTVTDDTSYSSEVIYSNVPLTHSVFDIPLRSEQIEYIRNALNPSKTSNANFRIECTVIRDLLDSEIDYVKSLRSVVQDFIPEMTRDDLPATLRGKKSQLFGNIEKLFQFHAHVFLPQLISRLRFRPTEDSLSLTVGSLFVEHAMSFNLYSLYAKNKPKADALMRESGGSFFSSVKGSKDVTNLLVRPIERIGKYTLALQQLLNAASPNRMEILEVLHKAVNVVSFQIRHGANLLAMERITGCDLNLREQGALLRNDTMCVTEKRGLYAKKRMRSVFLFTNSVVITKPRLRKDHLGRSYDELRYKASIQVIMHCGLTEMVKTSKTKFELWFRKQTASFTYVMETQSPCIRDLWVHDIRSLLWKQAIKSREDSLLEKANMGIGSLPASIFPLAPLPTSVVLRNRDWGDGSRRPCSLISLTASSCSSSNNVILRGSSAHGYGTGEVIASDLGRLEEIEECDIHTKDYSCSLPRYNAPPPPEV
uniref:DH domain-containing protein n=1 Tax=Enterobius vermicularis TaxID=51028 RepID=A0A158Q9G4_ENTVE